MKHILDRPAWSALTTRHAALAEGGDLARRYRPSIVPFAAARDDSEESLRALGELAGPVLIVNGHLHVHATIADGRILQLSVAALIEPPHDVTLLTLGFDDAGNPRVARQASGLFETPGVSLPVLSDREETWQFRDGVWHSS